jgi:hypothetical protein
MNTRAAEERQLLVGLDLGQQRDYTALCVDERVAVETGRTRRRRVWDQGLEAWQMKQVPETLPEHRIRHLERLPLGTPYVDVVARVVEIVKQLSDPEAAAGTAWPIVVVDATGVGRPVCEMLWRRLSAELALIPGRGFRRVAVTITGGDAISKIPDGGIRVPKRDLVSATLVLFQDKRLKIAEELPLAEVLKQELLNFRVKINIATAHDSYEAWREGDHDDLVLAVALACWAGERYLGTPVPPRARSYSF